MDFHCDGKVNYSEFLAATISTINFNKEEKLWSAFNYFDTTDSGYITLDSVMDALKDSGVIIDEEGLKKAFSELQKKGKKINFDEFKAIVLGKEIVEEEYELIKEEEQDDKNKINLKLSNKDNNKVDNINKNNKNLINKIYTTSEKEEKKESQDIYFDKINFSVNNIMIKQNKENNDNKYNNREEQNKKEDNSKEEKNDKSNNMNSNANINYSNKNNSKSNNKSNNKSNSKSNNNKSSKSNNNKSSKSNKSNIDVLIVEQSIEDNNDRFTEVNENKN